MIDEADRLYGLPLEDFVPERDALAKKLRGEGNRAEADAVKALRKPTAVVWAVNQVMRTQRGPARALIRAADRAAKNPGDRDALRAHADALDELARAAGGLLSGAGRGLSEDAVLRVRSALHGASLDREARDDFLAGRLTSEPAPVGFGAITAMPKARPKAAKAKAKAKAAPKAKPKPKGPSPAAQKRVARAEAQVAKARAALADAERDLAEERAALEAEQG
jgi:plasmid stability protein